MMRKLVLAAGAMVIMCGAHAQQGMHFSYEPMRPRLESTPYLIDDCATKIASGREINPAKDWPDYCNHFRDSDIIQARVEELKKIKKDLKLSKAQAQYVQNGQIWVGAPAKAAELSWGRPKKINRTTSARGTREQWVYASGSYLYFDNGRLTTIQN